MLPTHNIPTGTYRKLVDGIHWSIKLKTPKATFTLRPVLGEPEKYQVMVTPKDLPGLFNNSGISTFGWFEVIRYPQRNAVVRPDGCGPIAGNAVLMWPSLVESERTKCFDFLEKLCRSELPKIPKAEVAA